MKFSFLKILFLVLIACAVSQAAFSQKETQAILFDEFGEVCYEDFSARYDSFANALQNDPASNAFIVFNGNKSREGANLNFVKALLNYAVIQRGLDKSRIVIFRGENLDKAKTQFWLVPAGANTPETGTAFKNEKISATSRFDSSWADFYKSEGKLDIYQDGFHNLGCDFLPNTAEFSKVLLADENLTGYLVIYGNKKSRAERVVKFAADDLVKNYKVPRKRLKTVYGGKREEPQIEFWFVPKNDKPPVVNSN